MFKLLRDTKGWKLPLIAIAGLVFAAYITMSDSSIKMHEPTLTPVVAPFDHSVAGIGVVEPKSEVINLGVEIPGVVRRIFVNPGDVVKKGTPLFALDQREADAQVQAYTASLAAARIQAQDAADQYAIVAGMKDKRAVSKDDVNRRKHARDLGAARVKEIEAQLTQARTNRDRLTIKSPISGQVLEINIRPGEYASAGVLAEPLMRLGDVSALHVRVEIDEENATKIAEGASAKAYRRGDPATAIALTFVRFEPFVQPKKNLAVAGQRVDTRVLQVIYAVEHSDKPVFIGQQMDVFIETAEK